MQPNNHIDWQFELMDEPTFGSVKPEEPKKVTFGFGPKKQEDKPEPKKPSFGFGPKTSEPAKQSTFSFGTKQTD